MNPRLPIPEIQCSTESRGDRLIIARGVPILTWVLTELIGMIATGRRSVVKSGVAQATPELSRWLLRVSVIVAVGVAACSGATINVKDHGATGDGITNDQSAIKAAFDAAADGSTIYFPAGTYFFASGIILTNRNGLSLTGDPGALLKAAGGRSKFILSFEKCSDITVSGLKFDLNGVTHFGPGLAFQDARRIRVHGNHFFDGNFQPKMTADRYAIAFRLSDPGNEDIWITDNLIEHLQVEVDTARRVHVCNNRSFAPELACGFGSFTLKDNSFVEDIEFVGNYVEDPQGYAICVAADGKREGAAMRRILIANNIVSCKKRAPMLAAISVGSRAEANSEVANALWEGITVANNFISYGPRINKRHQESGIRVQCVSKGETLTKVRITGNTIVDESGIANAGIETQRLTDAVISDNAIYGTKAGVVLGEGWARTLVQGNRVSDVPGEAYSLKESGGENRFINNFVFGKVGTPFAISGLQPSDHVEQSPSPPPAAVGSAPTGEKAPSASKPAAEAPARTTQPGKSDVTGELVGIANARERTTQPHDEAFDSIDKVKPMRGYQAAETKIALVEDDRKEGKASVKAAWTSATAGAGVGGIQKQFEPADFTGRKFSVWAKPLTPQPLANVAVALYDADKKRAQVLFWYPHRFKDWTQLTFTAGGKGNADSGGEVKGDLTRIVRIEFYGTTRAGSQACEVLWDGFTLR